MPQVNEISWVNLSFIFLFAMFTTMLSFYNFHISNLIFHFKLNSYIFKLFL